MRRIINRKLLRQYYSCDTYIWLLRKMRKFVKPRFIILHGYYGNGNIGDEAILVSTLAKIKDITKYRPLIFSRNPKRILNDYGEISINPYAYPIIALTKAFLYSKAYLLGGGGIIKDFGENSNSLVYGWLYWLDMAIKLEIRTMLWSIGVEKIIHARSKNYLLQVIENVDEIIVRDHASRQRLIDLGITKDILVTSDPVLSLVVQNRRVRDVLDRNPKVIVCPRNWFPNSFQIPDKEINQLTINSLAEALDYLILENDMDVTFMPFRTVSGDDDREMCYAIRDEMQNSEYATVYSADNLSYRDAVKIIQPAKLLIGMRLHSLIVGTALGVPSIALSYSPKVMDFMESIDMQHMCIKMDNDINANKLKNLMEFSLMTSNMLSQSLKTKTFDLSTSYELNGKTLGKLVTDN